MPPSPAAPAPAPRCKPIDRWQLVMRTVDVEHLIEADHPARLFWEITGRLDLSRFYTPVKAVAGKAGREPHDPRLLISVWLYAYRRGVGSAREISRLCETDPGLQWLTGMGWINAHTLGDFRIDHQDALDALFTQVLGLLLDEGLITLERVTQDGTKIRACARQNSFRREERIRQHLEEARQHLAALGDPRQEPASQHKQNAEHRAARQRQAHLERALTEIQTLRETKKQDKKTYEPRVSETDPEARLMKTGEGGFVPCYNAQITTDAAHGLMVSAVVVNDVNDHAQLEPAMTRLAETLGRKPQQVLADGDFTNNRSVVAMEKSGIDFYGSWTESGQDPTKQKKAAAAPEFQRAAFRFNPERNEFVCPAGQVLPHTSTMRPPNGTLQLIYRAPVATCRACAHHSRCCPPQSKTGRMLTRQQEVPAVTRFRAKMETDEAQAIYRSRSQVAEFPHAWLKEKLGLARFHLQGKRKAGMELLWAALTYNLSGYFRLRPAAVAA